MHSPTPGITKVGHLSRTYTELAGRTTPTATDVEAALADCKLNIQGLEEYAKRPERRHVQKREEAPTPPPLSLSLSLSLSSSFLKAHSVLLCCYLCAACKFFRTSVWGVIAHPTIWEKYWWLYSL